MKFHSKLGGFKKISEAADGASHSQKDHMEANWPQLSRSLAKVLMEHAVLVESGFELVPRPSNFTELDLPTQDECASGRVGAD